ncbi:response regulator [Gemmatimonas groenlandica]|uniref:Response regulator n=1 Tax=Gemmatimonas groenlandica TaxID=2732249 RepID=A0A6M4IL26_9BACT|nr:response regulator [Gemmatimonas groenlandica]QJR35423.1 response regulator [Gemmatimonas groenlandica]
MHHSKVLIIEDDADVRLGYRVLLKAHGYETCFAGDGMSAISSARHEKPDLIILDLGLPAGDGYLVLERFRSNTHLMDIPVIVVSARDQVAHKDRALAAGAKAYLQKPWIDEVLLGLLARFLGHVAPLRTSSS